MWLRSAKILVKGEPNVSYICSRYYRAPELIFGATDYTCCIDTWSAGCVLAELLLGVPLFPGESGVDQLVEIIKVLGTPTLEEIQKMNQNYSEYKFPQVKPHPWSKVFRPRTPSDAIDLVSHFLKYAPESRLTPLMGCTMPLFDELRDQNLKLPNNLQPPPLFDVRSFRPPCVATLRCSLGAFPLRACGAQFKAQELFEHPPSIKAKLIPAWYKEANGGGA